MNAGGFTERLNKFVVMSGITKSGFKSSIIQMIRKHRDYRNDPVVIIDGLRKMRCDTAA